MSKKNVFIVLSSQTIPDAYTTSAFSKFVTGEDFVFAHETMCGDGIVKKLCDKTGSTLVMLSGQLGSDVYEMLDVAIILADKNSNNTQTKYVQDKILGFEKPVIVIHCP